MKRSVWLVVGGVLLVALLGGAAYMGGKLLAPHPESSLTPGSAGGYGIGLSDGQGKAPSYVRFKPAPELPQTEPDEAGVFVRREDRSIFMGTGNTNIATVKDSPATPSASYDGVLLEVVVNQDTAVYRNTTDLPASLPAGESEVQETVAPGSIDEIGGGSMLRVWGEKTGDRIIAQALVYTQPTILNARPTGT